MIQKQEILQAIDKYLKKFPTDVYALETKKFIEQQENFWQRENIIGHVTVSAWIVDEREKKVLILHHKSLDKYIQVGGHIEQEDETIWQAAMREAKEETSLKTIYSEKQEIFCVDVHDIPDTKKAKKHKHYDIAIYMKANSLDSIEYDKEESNSIHWMSFDEIKNKTKQDIFISNMVSKTKEICID
jgi:ADP-ribose pyrophosphatase YjhB (NUDIX family)